MKRIPTRERRPRLRLVVIETTTNRWATPQLVMAWQALSRGASDPRRSSSHKKPAPKFLLAPLGVTAAQRFYNVPPKLAGSLSCSSRRTSGGQVAFFSATPLGKERGLAVSCRRAYEVSLQSEVSLRRLCSPGRATVRRSNGGRNLGVRRPWENVAWIARVDAGMRLAP